MSQYGQRVVAVIDTASTFGATVKQLKNNVETLQTQMSTLLADAPETLDTLNEIAAAISDDPAFFSTMASANTTLQSNIDAEATTRTNVVAALQALIDAATTARGLLSGRLDTLEADPTTGTALAAVQADVDQNEADADAAIALRAPIDDPTFTTKIASPEFHSDGGHLKFKADTNDILFYPNNTETLQITRHSSTGHPTFTANGGTGEFKFNQIADLAGGVKLAGTTVTATAAEINAFDGRLDTLEADPTTKSYVDTTISNLVDSAPGVLDTLNELAAAIDDDANFATTITNSIAAVQADVDQNETDADAADTALSNRIATLEADPTTATALAAVQADVDQNESDADAAIAAVQADVDQNESDADAAIAAVQADVDQNESDADTAIALRAPIASPAFTGQHITHTAGDTLPTTHSIIGGFPDLILKTNQGDFATHQNEGRILWDDAGGGSHGAIKMKQSSGQTMDFFVGGVTAGDKVMSIASDSVDVESLKINGTAVTSTAAELNQLDGITLGTAAQSASGDFATAAQGAKADSALQTHQDISGKANLAGGTTFTGNVSVAKNWPDFELKSGDEKRLLFSDAGGNATAGLKHVSGSLDFYVGGIAAGNKEMSLDTDGLDVTALKIDGTAITSTAAELNILDGVTATASELNILDGVTATATELNLLDGVTATTAELNYVDGVTSNIQTQLDATVSAADTTLTGLTTMESAKFSTVLPEYSNDTLAAAGGVPVGGLYRTMQLVKIRIS